MSAILQFCRVLEAVHHLAPERRFSLWIDGEKRNEGTIDDPEALYASAERLHDQGHALMAVFESAGWMHSLSLYKDGVLCTDQYKPAEGPISHSGGTVLPQEPAAQVARFLLQLPC